jgi:endoglycosylceramidase
MRSSVAGSSLLLLACGVVAAVVAAMAGCAPEPALPRAHAEHGRLLDEQGRELFLHGANARIEGLFDVTFDDGRLPVQPIPDFSTTDLRLLRDELGINALRIPINWSGLEPEPDQAALNADYLTRLDAVLEDCAALEVWCLVDLHQDAYSKEIGEDGAPLWAIIPAPEELLGGPLEDLVARRTSTQVLQAFDSFFNNVAGLQDAYLVMLQRLTLHLQEKPWVLGIEVFNEPVGDSVPILAFAESAVAAIHDVDPDRLVLWEPTALRNLTDGADTDGGLDLDNDAYAPHLYPEVFSGRADLWASGDPTRLVRSTDNARTEADAHDAPLVVTEYGNNPSLPHGLAWLARMQDEMDRVRAHRFFWLYEEISQDRWGLYDENRTLRDDAVATLARATPTLAGRLLTLDVSDDGVLSVTFEGGGDHLVTLPRQVFASGARARCDGVDIDVDVDVDVDVDSDSADGRVARVRCGNGGEHTLVVAPR